VANEQAGGLSYEELWAEHERLRAENPDLWQAWAEAEELSEAKQREVAASGSAMGLSLTQVVTVLAIVLPWAHSTQFSGWAVPAHTDSRLT